MTSFRRHVFDALESLPEPSVNPDTPTPVPPQETGFLNRMVTVGALTHRYQVYVPEKYSPDRRWPVILFLHGAGERGSDGLRQTEVGLGSAIRHQPRRFQAVVVFPQIAERTAWRGSALDVALLALDQTLAEFNGDPRRLYLSGISMGAYGAFRLVLERPYMFAALVAVCGGLDVPPRRRAGDPAAVAGDLSEQHLDAGRRLAHLPIWIFHGAADPIIPVAESRMMVDALRRAGADVRYTEYPRVGHDAWSRAYAEPEMLRWLMKQVARAEELV